MEKDPKNGRKRPVDPTALQLARERYDQGSYQRTPTPKKEGRLRRALRRRRAAADQPSRFVLVPAVLAPLVLVGGWSLAASAQTEDYDGLRDSLSSLAAQGASHREVMTWAFILLGLAHLGTAAFLRVAAVPGRALQAVGGAATILVAMLPLSSESDGLAHGVVAAVAFLALALWPAFAARPDGPPVLRPRTMRIASAVLAVLVLVFGIALVLDSLVGLTERVAALAEAVWPLIVAWMVREWGGGSGTPHVERPPEAPVPDDDGSPEDTPDPVDEKPDPRPEPAPSPTDEPAPTGRR